MKKGLLVFFALCLLLVGGIYVFIPAQFTVSRLVFAKVNSMAAYRCLIDPEKWAAWWPGTVLHIDTVTDKERFQYKNTTYQLGRNAVNALGVGISHNAMQTQSILQTIKYGPDSTALQWTCSLETGSNPFTKILKYYEAVRLQKDMDTVLKHLQTFLNKKENVYSIVINGAMLKDSTLIAMRMFSASYPDTETIYELIKQLEQYAIQQGAHETNYPMLHVEDRGSGQFETMVALPVNKELKDNGPIFFKRMQVPTTLATDVYGGPTKLKKANMELVNYLNDHYLFSPALSFESLVTNRLTEPDTAKWVTKIYVPVMEHETH